MNDMVDVVVTYLELDLPAVPASVPRAVQPLPGAGSLHLAFDRVPPPEAPAVAAAMYRAVGHPWHWTDRRLWTDADWRRAVDRHDVEVWVARVNGEVAGYFELHAEEASVELKYLGLMAEFTGRRIGASLLAAAIERARHLGRRKLTVNTCTLDHPAALANYVTRGFTIVRTESQRRRVPG